MTRRYFEAYRADDTEILGNLDGQASIRCTAYRRTAHYKALKSGTFKCMPYVAYWLVRSQSGAIQERIDNPNWREK